MKYPLAIVLCVLFFVVTLAGCSKYRVTFENMPAELKTRLEEQVAKGKELLAVAEDDSAQVKALLEIAYGNQQLGRYDLAIPRYEEMLALFQNDSRALNNLAVIYEDVEEYERAAKYYGRLLNADPGSIEALKDSIRALLAAEHFEDAQLTLENFAKYNKSNNNSGMAKLISDQFEQIRAARTKANSDAN